MLFVLIRSLTNPITLSALRSTLKSEKQYKKINIFRQENVNKGRGLRGALYTILSRIGLLTRVPLVERPDGYFYERFHHKDGLSDLAAKAAVVLQFKEVTDHHGVYEELREGTLSLIFVYQHFLK